MAAEQLQIQVQANVSNAIKGLNDLEKGLKSTETAGAKLGNAGLPQVAKGANQANTAMINLGRTVSDAPFGFIGIANNIGPLVENFTQLRKESGSTGGALKQLGASLAGPGGLIVGIQLAVAAVQFIQLGLSRWGVNAQKTKQQQDELSGSIASQYTQVLLLKSAYEQDKSLENRREIISQLNKVSSTYFGNLKAEETTIKQLEQAYTGYINNLLQSFAVKQLEADLEPLVKQLAIAQSTVRKISPDLEKLGFIKSVVGLTGEELQQAIKFNNELGNRLRNLSEEQRKALAPSGVTKYNSALNESNKLWNQINELIKNSTTLFSNSTTETTKQKESVDEIAQILQKYREAIAGINWDEQNRGLDGTKERLDTALDALKEITLKGVQPTANSFKFLTAEVERFRAALDYKNFRDNLERINKETKAQGAIRSQIDAELQKSLDAATSRIKQQITSEQALDKYRESQLKKQQELQLQFAGILTNEVGGAIDNMFDAFARGENVFESLNDSINSFIISIGKAVAKTLVLRAVTSAIAPGAGALGGGALGNIFSVRGDYLRNSIFA